MANCLQWDGERRVGEWISIWRLLILKLKYKIRTTFVSTSVIKCLWGSGMSCCTLNYLQLSLVGISTLNSVREGDPHPSVWKNSSSVTNHYLLPLPQPGGQWMQECWNKLDPGWVVERCHTPPAKVNRWHLFITIHHLNFPSVQDALEPAQDSTFTPRTNNIRCPHYQFGTVVALDILFKCGGWGGGGGWEKE